ncbi:helix-turn-helix transcriptional regulator [Cellulosimicrobium funkei]|nr:helix-turn-helix transcriptional regulator [Cellulosimicrobium funkei]
MTAPATRLVTARTLPRRTPEVEILVDILEGERSAGAVILGGPGMGKSSLVQTALEISGRTADVQTVQCSPHLREVPYGALTPLLTMLPALTTPVEVLRALQQYGANPVIVVVDVQHLDAASAFVLAQLVQNRAATLLTIGTGSLGRESGIAALADIGLLSTIRLEPADLNQVRRQCSGVLEGSLTEAAVRTIHGMTGGNPRLINAYLASAHDQGILVRAPKGAALPGRPAPWMLLRAAPDPDGRLIDTVEAMHDSLLPGERETLDLVALAGWAPRSLLRTVAGEHVHDLLASGFLREGETVDTVGLAAAIHAEVLRARIPPGRSFELYKRWHAAGGEASRQRTSRSVLWALECGQPVPLSEIMDAGYRALQAKDWPTARALSPALTESQDPRAALLVSELMLVGGRAWAASTELEELTVLTTDPNLRLEAISLMALNRTRTGEASNPWAALPALVSELRERLPQHTVAPDSLATVVDLLVNDAVHLHRPELLEQATVLVEDPQTPDFTRAIMLLMQADALAMSGRPDAAIQAAERAYDLSATVPVFSARFGLDALVYLVLAYITAGYTDRAQAVLADQLNLEPRQWHQQSGTVLLLQHLAETADGTPLQASAWLEDAVVELRHHDPVQMLMFAEALLASQRAAVTVGLPSPTAEERAARAPCGPESRWLWSLALFSIAEDRNPDAADEGRPLWRRILDDPRLEQDPVIRREILLSLILMRDPMDVEEAVVDEVHGITLATHGPRSAGIARALDPSLVRDPRGLAEAAEEAAAVGAVLPAALCWARLILLHHRTGDLRRRGEALRRLQHLQARAGVDFPPYIAGALALGELTVREQEIVDLAAQGLSNAAVAEKLFVSQRTVEGHLYRVFTKLGITDRSELRDLHF